MKAGSANSGPSSYQVLRRDASPYNPCQTRAVTWADEGRDTHGERENQREGCEFGQTAVAGVAGVGVGERGTAASPVPDGGYHQGVYRFLAEEMAARGRKGFPSVRVTGLRALMGEAAPGHLRSQAGEAAPEALPGGHPWRAKFEGGPGCCRCFGDTWHTSTRRRWLACGWTSCGLRSVRFSPLAGRCLRIWTGHAVCWLSHPLAAVWLWDFRPSHSRAR